MKVRIEDITNNVFKIQFFVSTWLYNEVTFDVNFSECDITNQKYDIPKKLIANSLLWVYRFLWCNVEYLPLPKGWEEYQEENFNREEDWLKSFYRDWVSFENIENPKIWHLFKSAVNCENDDALPTYHPEKKLPTTGALVMYTGWAESTFTLKALSDLVWNKISVYGTWCRNISRKPSGEPDWMVYSDFYNIFEELPEELQNISSYLSFNLLTFLEPLFVAIADDFGYDRVFIWDWLDCSQPRIDRKSYGEYYWVYDQSDLHKARLNYRLKQSWINTMCVSLMDWQNLIQQYQMMLNIGMWRWILSCDNTHNRKPCWECHKCLRIQLILTALWADLSEWGYSKKSVETFSNPYLILLALKEWFLNEKITDVVLFNWPANKIDFDFVFSAIVDRFNQRSNFFSGTVDFNYMSDIERKEYLGSQLLHKEKVLFEYFYKLL